MAKISSTSSSVTGRSKNRKKRSTPSAKSRLKWVGLSLLAISVLAFAVLWVFRLMDRRPDFDAENALNLVKKQVEFGPRVPGTPAHLHTRDYLVETLQGYAEQTDVQRFTFADRHDSSKVYTGYNIVASFNMTPADGRRVLLSAHWDSRPRADQEKDPARKLLPVPGANDGASGVAVLLEVARVLKENPPNIGVDIVLFDLEDLGDEPSADSTLPVNPFAIGSEAFVAANPDYRPAYGLLLDMVCDANLQIAREANSMAAARPIVDLVWDAAKRVDAAAFVDRQGGGVYDDHIAFLKRGIRVIDLIHTPFPAYWHTTTDTPDKCSVNSLQQVGDVVLEVLYSE